MNPILMKLMLPHSWYDITETTENHCFFFSFNFQVCKKCSFPQKSLRCQFVHRNANIQATVLEHQVCLDYRP